MTLLIPEQSASLVTALDSLGRQSRSSVRGSAGGSEFQDGIVIPGYPENIARHFAGLIDGTLESMCRKASVPVPHQDFGLTIDFDRPLEIKIYDQAYVLDRLLRKMIARFGPVVLRNVYMSEKCRAEGQRNIFPHLSFHLDRGYNQDKQYSLFCRDPFDEVQKDPRRSSTLVAGNMVCYLQKMLEADGAASPLGAQCDLFKGGNLGIGEIVLEQAWNAPMATGEICIIDNRTVMHASLYKPSKGYPIGVRYLD